MSVTLVHLGEYIVCGLGGVAVAAVIVKVLDRAYEIAIRVRGGI